MAKAKKLSMRALVQLNTDLQMQLMVVKLQAATVFEMLKEHVRSSDALYNQLAVREEQDKDIATSKSPVELMEKISARHEAAQQAREHPDLRGSAQNRGDHDEHIQKRLEIVMERRTIKGKKPLKGWKVVGERQSKGLYGLPPTMGRRKHAPTGEQMRKARKPRKTR